MATRLKQKFESLTLTCALHGMETLKLRPAKALDGAGVLVVFESSRGEILGLSRDDLAVLSNTCQQILKEEAER